MKLSWFIPLWALVFFPVTKANCLDELTKFDVQSIQLGEHKVSDLAGNPLTLSIQKVLNVDGEIPGVQVEILDTQGNAAQHIFSRHKNLLKDPPGVEIKALGPRYKYGINQENGSYSLREYMTRQREKNGQALAQFQQHTFHGQFVDKNVIPPYGSSFIYQQQSGPHDDATIMILTFDNTGAPYLLSQFQVNGGLVQPSSADIGYYYNANAPTPVFPQPSDFMMLTSVDGEYQASFQVLGVEKIYDGTYELIANVDGATVDLSAKLIERRDEYTPDIASSVFMASIYSDLSNILPEDIASTISSDLSPRANRFITLYTDQDGNLLRLVLRSNHAQIDVPTWVFDF